MCALLSVLPVTFLVVHFPGVSVLVKFSCTAQNLNAYYLSYQELKTCILSRALTGPEDNGSGSYASPSLLQTARAIPDPVPICQLLEEGGFIVTRRDFGRHASDSRWGEDACSLRTWFAIRARGRLKGQHHFPDSSPQALDGGL